MLNKILAPILVFNLLCPASVFAQDTGEAQPQYTHLSEGDAAPFDGTLFNPVATAQLIAEHQFAMSGCDLRVEYEIAKLDAQYQLQIESLLIGSNAQNERLNLLIEAKDLEIETYREMALERPNRNSHWWAIGGFVLGAAASIGIFHVSVGIAHEQK